MRQNRAFEFRPSRRLTESDHISPLSFIKKQTAATEILFPPPGKLFVAGNKQASLPVRTGKGILS
jgi:hypothetical protein